MRLRGDATEPSDEELFGRVRAGREDALRTLMARYDRLVRYTILRTARRHCLRDPQWLDGLASEVWTGFLGSVERGSAPPASRVTAYLIQITRNKCVDAARRLPEPADRDPVAAEGPHPDAADAPDPLAALTQVEDLARLRDCVTRLDDPSRRLFGEIAAIVDRRWQEAGQRLGMSESTLRSRWQGVMEKLRRCMRSKM